MEEIMKKAGLQICSLLALVIILTVVSAQAQTQYKAHVPFDFTLGQETLQAGDYVIALTSRNSSQQALTIREEKSNKSRIVLVVPKEANEKSEISRLVFNRYDGRYFLAEMMTPSLGAEFRQPKLQRSLGKTQKPKIEVVAIVK
jgi:hypothetical protein